MKKRILFMDNLPGFLGASSRLLEDAGYEVLKAQTLAEAELVLQEKHIHLAILDVRMKDEDDDSSGLSLAQREEYRSIPKIILTAYPSVEYACEALRLGPKGPPPAVNFVSKKEAHETLIEAVKQAFEKHVRINWTLVIQVNERDPVTFHRLAELIAPGLAGEHLRSRAEEVEDLFRRLCCDEEQVKLDRVLWHRERRVAVAVLAFTHGKAPESLVIVCGPNASLSDEARRYREFSPKAPGENGTVLARSSETAHFAGNAYALAGADLEDVCSLSELYHRGPGKPFSLAMATLFDKTLGAWHRDKRVPEEAIGPCQLYADRLGLAADSFPPNEFAKRLRALIRQVPAIGARIECVSGKLKLDFEGQSYLYPDPTSFLYGSYDVGEPTVLIQTPGALSGENILADMKGRTWLTDFASAGLAPMQWNFVALEATIRFDWVDVKNLHWLHQMEQLLVSDEFLKLPVSDLEAPLRRPVRAIEALRRVASRQTGRDWMQYHLGIFFQAVRRIADFNPNHKLASNDLARMAHVLIAAALIAKCVGEGRSGPSASSRSEPMRLRVDTVNQEVKLAGRRVTLSQQSYALLRELNERAGKLCTRRELVERALGEEYDPTDESQIGRLNTAVHRLREKIEDNPDEPRYIITEQGRGYRLVLEPGGSGRSQLAS